MLAGVKYGRMDRNSAAVGDVLARIVLCLLKAAVPLFAPGSINPLAGKLLAYP
jgi:hypothetical protein